MHEKNKGKVIVGMSGGVDSAVAAHLLKEAGFEVTGVTLRTWEGESSRCCEIDEAQRTARMLEISYHPWNAADCFREHVMKPFLENYIHGQTPNPCIECNRYVKWARLLHIADVMQADYVATGHYASVTRLPNGRFAVKQAADEGKDQSYMLYRLTQEQLSRTLLPLGNLRKAHVREIAARAGLSVAHKTDSQEICFVTEGSYADYIEKELGQGCSPEGNFVDEKGNVLGRHQGIIHYTVGQRKGLGIALGYPAYVKGIRAETNEVIIGNGQSLYTEKILCGAPSFMGIPDLEEDASLQAEVRIRYHHKGESAVLRREGTFISVSFEKPVRAPTPGQSAVFYDENHCILGGGKIIPFI